MEAKQEEARCSIDDFRRKLYTLSARIRRRERAIEGKRIDLQHGVFTEIKMKCPKMYTEDSQTIVNAAVKQVERVVFHRIISDEETKLAEDKKLYKAMVEELHSHSGPIDNNTFRVFDVERKANQPQIPRKLTRLELQQELRDLQIKCKTFIRL